MGINSGFKGLSSSTYIDITEQHTTSGGWNWRISGRQWTI